MKCGIYIRKEHPSQVQEHHLGKEITFDSMSVIREQLVFSGALDTCEDCLINDDSF